MTKSKSLPSSIVVSSIFVIHSVNGAQSLNATFVAGAVTTVISPLTKMKALLQSQRLDLKTYVL